MRASYARLITSYCVSHVFAPVTRSIIRVQMLYSIASLGSCEMCAQHSSRPSAKRNVCLSMPMSCALRVPIKSFRNFARACARLFFNLSLTESYPTTTRQNFFLDTGVTTEIISGIEESLFFCVPPSLFSCLY